MLYLHTSLDHPQFHSKGLIDYYKYVSSGTHDFQWNEITISLRQSFVTWIAAKIRKRKRQLCELGLGRLVTPVLFPVLFR